MVEIDEFTRLNGYYTHITQADIFPMVQRARKKALTKANIIHGFEHAGIYPFNRSKIPLQNQARTTTPPIPRRQGYAQLPPLLETKPLTLQLIFLLSGFKILLPTRRNYVHNF